MSMKLTRRDFGRGLLGWWATVPVLGWVWTAAVVDVAAQQPEKVSRSKAAYQTSPKNGEKCSGCAQFESPASCRLVSGQIVPNGWCKLYVAREGDGLRMIARPVAVDRRIRPTADEVLPRARKNREVIRSAAFWRSEGQS